MVFFIHQAAARRKRIFVTVQVPNLTDLSEAQISALRPLRVDDYGVIVIETTIHKEVKVSVMVGRGKFPMFSDYPDTQHKIPFAQSLHSTPKAEKAASIAQSVNCQTFPPYPTWRFKFLNPCMLDNSALYWLPQQSSKPTSFYCFHHSIFWHSLTTRNPLRNGALFLSSRLWIWTDFAPYKMLTSSCKQLSSCQRNGADSETRTMMKIRVVLLAY